MLALLSYSVSLSPCCCHQQLSRHRDALTGALLDAQLTIAGSTVCSSYPPGVTQECQEFLTFPAPSTAFVANIATVSAVPTCTSTLFTRTGEAPGDYDALYFTQFFAPPALFWTGAPAGCVLTDPSQTAFECFLHLFFTLL